MQRQHTVCLLLLLLLLLLLKLLKLLLWRWGWVLLLPSIRPWCSLLRLRWRPCWHSLRRRGHWLAWH
jgi:hypothetical protein